VKAELDAGGQLRRPIATTWKPPELLSRRRISSALSRKARPGQLPHLTKARTKKHPARSGGMFLFTFDGITLRH
jgi:hypothetical protein